MNSSPANILHWGSDEIRSCISGVERFVHDLPGDGTIVFTNGCFDLFHPGHLNVIEYARNLVKPWGGLVVAINSDSSVRSLKGSDRPIVDEMSRAKILTGIRGVDIVIIYDEPTPIDIISVLKPDIIVKGFDYANKDVVGREYAREVCIAPECAGWSTSTLIERIRNS